MNKILALLLASVMILTACSSSQTIYPQQQAVDTGKAPVNTQQGGAGDMYQSMFDSVKSDTLAKNDKTQELFVPMTYKAGKAGDAVVFGGVFNPLNKPKGTFLAKIIYIEGRDTNSNLISVDKTTIGTWIRNSEGNIIDVTQASGPYYLPFIFSIGDEIKPGEKTPTGTYYFEVQMYQRNSGFDDKIGTSKKISVRVN